MIKKYLNHPIAVYISIIICGVLFGVPPISAEEQRDNK